MKKIFEAYGRYYDVIYKDKDYKKECNFLEEIFRTFSKPSPKTILDLGCGTGGHAIPLAKRDFKVTGVDFSEVMINIAKEKAKKAGVVADFYKIDLRELKLNKKFDACICMFAVMNYLTDNEDIQKALHNIRKLLKNASLFIFDFWYGPAVLTILPSVRTKVAENEGIKVIKLAEPHLDTLHHICEVDYRLIVANENQIMEEVKEKHRVRFFFPEEIRHYLEENGFKLLRLCPFLDLNADPSEKTWNVAAIAQAISNQSSTKRIVR